MIRTPAALLSAALFASAALAHDDDAASGGQQLGKVNFPSSCSPKVQQKVTRGVAMLHSFWFPAGEALFQEIAAEDPNCAIAAWGFASVLINNPFVGITPAKEVARAQAAIEKGRQMKASQRDKDYLEAVAAYWDDFSSKTERQRSLARSAAYQKLAAKYPKDDEAQIFNGLYLIATQQASDQTYAESLKAAAILEKQFAKYPNHPGVAHYLIHAYDAPPTAQKGLPSARKYAGIAPDAPHALHMPSHIFTRVGAWQDSVTTNRRSADVAVKGKDFDDALHASDYIVYAQLQMARDGDARKTYEEAAKINPSTPRFVGPYPLALMPARLAIERGAWREAAQLQPVKSQYPFTEANTYLARAMGAARSGDVEAAKKDLQEIEARRDALKAANNNYWASEVEVMRLSASAWIALAEKRNDEALSLMRQAADAEDKNEKHPVTPGRLLPAREQLGDMLMEVKRPKEALAEYEQSMQREPNRFRGYYGAALAAEMAGDGKSARKYYTRLVQVAGKGDERAEITLARNYLAQ